MLTVEGIYQNGQVLLDEKVDYAKPTKVIVTFLEETTITHDNQTKLIADLYASGKISFKQVQALFNHDNWQQTVKILEKYGCQLHYDEDDLNEDLKNLSLFS